MTKRKVSSDFYNQAKWIRMEMGWSAMVSSWRWSWGKSGISSFTLLQSLSVGTCLYFQGGEREILRRLSPDGLQPFQVAGGHFRVLKSQNCSLHKSKNGDHFWRERCPKYGAFDRGTIFPNKSYLSWNI